MNKIYINNEIYNNLALSLKVNFQQTSRIQQPDGYDPNTKLLQIDNKFYFIQNINQYFGVKKIIPKISKSFSLMANNEELMFLLIFNNISQIFQCFKDKKTFTFKSQNRTIHINFFQDIHEIKIGRIHIDFSEKTLAIYMNKNNYRWNLFASFYDDEMYCKISKRKKLTSLDLLTPATIIEATSH